MKLQLNRRTKLQQGHSYSFTYKGEARYVLVTSVEFDRLTAIDLIRTEKPEDPQWRSFLLHEIEYPKDQPLTAWAGELLHRYQKGASPQQGVSQ